MKYVILHGAGMADVPRQDLGGQTPLQMAATPHMDLLASQGEVGMVTLPAEALPLGPEAVPLALLGYDPRTVPPTSGTFQAASLGVALEKTDVAFQGSLVTLRAVTGRSGTTPDLKKLGPQVQMEDETAGGIETEDARELIAALNEQLGSEAIQFYPGSGHRHLMVWAGGKSRITCVPPQHVVGRAVSDFLPSGEGSEILRQAMEASVMILRHHPVNGRRQEAGLKPANCLWLWGPGRASVLPSVTDRHRITGTVLSATDAVRGIAICAGFEATGAEGFSGEREGRAQAEAALQALRHKDLGYVHVQVPAEAARDTEPKAKIRAVEEFDRDIVGPILQGLSSLGPHRVLLVCDPPLPGAGGQLGEAPLAVMPYALYDSARQAAGPASRGFSEASAAAQGNTRGAMKILARLLATR
jgi:2,3-bisphosphoglycerate-independent phosphoglycerate mutase